DDFGSHVDERTLQLPEDDEVFTETELYEVTYNERGLITLETASYLYDEEEYVEKLIYDYTIDPDKDAVCQTLTSVFNSEDDETVPETKVVVTAFTGLSGLAAVAVDATEIACRLSGRSLEISSPGATAVSVFTTDGRLAASKTGADWFSLDLNGLSTGFYLVRVAGQGATRTFKIALK
ncbi:MAG: T9SS type A sorting domain-containing protein, partial [Muribaculaceae bacterium]|nr:T9SS type A sorting domain-containing protein [Muribaculaceae bacterium]